MNVLKRIALAVALTAGLCFLGCEKESAMRKRPPAANADHGHDHDDGGHGHDDHGHGHNDHHSAAGPHGGQVIDLSHDGSHHAELTDDHSTDTVTVYILDKELKEMKTEQTSVTLMLTANGKNESFELTGDGTMFSASSPAMLELLEADGSTGKIRVNIDGKPMSGVFSDHEEHDDHGHDH